MSSDPQAPAGRKKLMDLLNQEIQQHQSTGLALPEVEPPSLEGLEVAVPRLPPVSEQDVTARLSQLARALGERRTRELGEPVQQGDDVVVDMVVTAFGRLVPMLARADSVLALLTEPYLPGLCEGLVGTPVGARRHVQVTLPADFPVRSLRGAPASCQVDVRGACEVKPLGLSSPAFLTRLNRGRTLEEVRRSIHQRLEIERAQVQESMSHDHVLAAVLARMGAVSVSPALVREELRLGWEKTEGPTLEKLGHSAEQRQAALEAWLALPELQADAERRLRTAALLNSVLRSERVTPSQALTESLARRVASRLGISPEEFKGALQQDTRAQSQFQQLVWQSAAMDYLRGKASLRPAP
jgi:trigger factor